MSSSPFSLYSHSGRIPGSVQVTAPPLEPLPVVLLALGVALTDVVVFFGAFVGSLWLRDAAQAFGHHGSVMNGAGLVSAAGLAVFALHGLYDPVVFSRGWRQIARLTRAWGLLAAVVILGLFLFKTGDPLRSRIALTLFLVLGWTASLLVRGVFWRQLLRLRFARSLRGARVIVGTGPLARRLAVAGEAAGFWEPELVGFADDEDPGPRAAELPAPYLGDLETVRVLAREGRVSQVLVAREDLSRGSLVQLARSWMEDGLQVALASSAFEVMVGRASGEVLGGTPLVELQRSPQHGVALFLKRALDVSAVLVGGLFLLPLLATIAVAVKLGSPGPVFYRQTRVGKQGRRFTMVKFRSMVVGNDDDSHKRYVEDLIHGTGKETRTNREGNRVYKLVNDPRVTPLGKLLRRTSLDELPQLWNVFRGDMSLVGPRPCLPYEWDLYQDWQRHRLEVYPGITGLWQVTARSQVSFEDMVLLDLHYIANWSILGDLSLLGRTIPVVFGGKGAH